MGLGRSVTNSFLFLTRDSPKSGRTKMSAARQKYSQTDYNNSIGLGRLITKSMSILVKDEG